MTRIQEYLRPTSISQAIEMKADRGSEAFFLSGGTDVLLFPPDGATTAIDVMHLGLDQVSQEDGVIEIGANALLRDIERHPVITPVAGGAFREAITETAPWLIRNAATLTGNICNASPSADSVPMLLALDGSVVLSDGTVIPLDKFFTGPHRTVLAGRLVTTIRIEPRGRTGVFHKLSRSKSDIAQVNLAITAQVVDGRLRAVRVALGSVAPTPVRAYMCEEMLEGQELTETLFVQAAAQVRTEISPIDDWRATAAYREHAAGVMVSRGLAKLAGLSQVEVT